MHHFIIEHPGTNFYNRLANQMSDLLGYDLGYTSEFMIGSESDNLTLHYKTDSGLQEVGSFSSLPARETLRLYISLAT